MVLTCNFLRSPAEVRLGDGVDGACEIGGLETKSSSGTMKAGGQRTNRSRSLRRGSSPDQPAESTYRSTASLCRSILHLSLCMICMVLGFRVSRESLVAVANLKGTEYLSDSHFHPHLGASLSNAEAKPNTTDVAVLRETSVIQDLKSTPTGVKSSRVHVGRHGILVRPWPHPDPVDLLKAHHLILTVQQEQRKLYGLSERKQIIVITPTYRRTYQALHLSCLMHTLMLVPGPLTWIVIEAKTASEETSSLLSESGLDIHHLDFPWAMPGTWSEQAQIESQMRIRGLRHVREMKMEGVIVFADESNSHRLELFDEVQSVHWVGALSIGLLGAKSFDDDGNYFKWGVRETPSTPPLPVQGPACNESYGFVGWHIPESLESGMENSGTKSGHENLKWAGFVLNSAVVLEGVDRPKWIRDWDEWIPQDSSSVMGPTAMVMDESFIEPLGHCGNDILLWWVRAEARADSKYPHGWRTDPQLEVTVPARHTPWPKPVPPVHLSPEAPSAVVKSVVDLGSEVTVAIHTQNPRSKQQGKRNPRRSEKKKPDTVRGKRSHI